MTPTAIGVVGVGATGARTVRQLVGADGVDRVVLAGPGERPTLLQRSVGERAQVGDPLDDPAVSVVVVAGPSGSQYSTARRAIGLGKHVVSTSDDPDEVRDLLDLDALARGRGVAVVVGAGFSPGLSCLLARHVAGWVDEVDEIHIARFGTGGPACARQHHRALRGRAVNWRDGSWVRRPGGSGRELVVFPEPVGSIDCYRAALADSLLLQPIFPDAHRITSRQAANRRQRLTTWLPMLRRPHPEGRIGAIQVEVRGFRGGAAVTETVGAIDRPAVAAGAVAGVAARWAAAGRLVPGAAGLAGSVEAVPFLQELSGLGVRTAVFEGAT